jgi:hypothetical protein
MASGLLTGTRDIKQGCCCQTENTGALRVYIKKSMKLIAHAYKATMRAGDTETARLSRLAWVVLNKEGKPVRGFDFFVSPDDWGTSDIADARFDGCATVEMLRDLGHRPDFVLKKFTYDYERSDELYVLDADKFTELLTKEAIRYHVAASNKPKIKRSVKGLLQEGEIDLSHGIRQLVEKIFASEEIFS